MLVGTKSYTAKLGQLVGAAQKKRYHHMFGNGN
jgi:hypothetical protein